MTHYIDNEEDTVGWLYPELFEANEPPKSSRRKPKQSTKGSWKRVTPEHKRGRAALGKYLKRKRTDAGLTQNDLGKLLGFDYYTFVSQVETGSAALPEDCIAAWADALGIDAPELAKRVIAHLHPDLFAALYHGK